MKLLYGELFRLETGGPIMFSADPVIPEIANKTGWRVVQGLRQYDVMITDASRYVKMGIIPLYSDPPRAIRFAFAEVRDDGVLLGVTQERF
jgi:hypothetical protein